MWPYLFQFVTNLTGFAHYEVFHDEISDNEIQIQKWIFEIEI